MSVDLDFVLDNDANWDTVVDVDSPTTNTLHYTSRQIEYAFGGLGIDTLYTLDQNSSFGIDGVTVDTDPLFKPETAPLWLSLPIVTLTPNWAMISAMIPLQNTSLNLPTSNASRQVNSKMSST